MLRMEIPRIVVTNLSDRLQTEVTIDNATGIDIRRLNQDSIHTDEHQAHYTTIKDMSVNPLTVRKVVMVKPILTKDDSGNFSAISNLYVDAMAVNTITADNINVKSLSTMDILVSSLGPALYIVDGVHADALDAAALDVAYATVD